MAAATEISHGQGHRTKGIYVSNDDEITSVCAD